MKRIGRRFNHASKPRCPECNVMMAVVVTGLEQRTCKGGPFGLPVRGECGHSWVTTSKAVLMAEWKRKEKERAA